MYYALQKKTLLFKDTSEMNGTVGPMSFDTGLYQECIEHFVEAPVSRRSSGYIVGQLPANVVIDQAICPLVIVHLINFVDDLLYGVTVIT